MKDWLSIARAAKILEPGSGGFDLAQERVTNALRDKLVRVKSTRRSPPHEMPEWNEVAGTVNWFDRDRDRERAIIQGMADERTDWHEFLFDGGLVVSRQDIEALDGPRSWEKVTPELIAASKGLTTNWNLPEALAWVATRDYEQVTQIGCDAAWRRIDGEETYNGQRVFEEFKQRASIGWLIRFVSLHHCACGARTNDDREAWEICSCTISAFDQLWDAVNCGNLAAYDKLSKAPIAVGEVPGFELDRKRFTLAAPRHPGAVVFRRVDIERLWPSKALRLYLRLGEPGRPSLGRELYQAEHKRRLESNEAEQSVKVEAAYLAEWMRANHGTLQQPTQGTIENRIRAAHRNRPTQN